MFDSCFLRSIFNGGKKYRGKKRLFCKKRRIICMYGIVVDDVATKDVGR